IVVSSYFSKQIVKPPFSAFKIYQFYGGSPQNGRRGRKNTNQKAGFSDNFLRLQKLSQTMINMLVNFPRVKSQANRSVSLRVQINKQNIFSKRRKISR